MKSIFVFVAGLLIASAAVRAEKSVCPAYPAGRVRCFADPCLSSNCAASEICCQDYSAGCNFHCIPAEAEPEPELEDSVCPAYPAGNVRCMVDPCFSSNCAASETCCQDYSAGCNFHCIPAKVEPEPVPFQCPAFEVNANCFMNPCSVNNCEAGQTCCNDFSKGCDFQCLPAKVQPEPEPVPFQCPAFEVNANCFMNPCSVNNCEAHQTCCNDFSKGCDYQCLPATPEPEPDC